jgi:hypothetical protein
MITKYDKFNESQNDISHDEIDTKFEHIYSTDVDYMQSNLIIIKRNNELRGISFQDMDEGILIYNIDIESFPDWIDLLDVESYTGVHYTGKETGDDLYNLISDCINYYGAINFDGTPFQTDVNTEDFTNQEFINLVFPYYKNDNFNR